MEKGNELGGQLILATSPEKQALITLLNFLKVQVSKSGVRVILNKEATPAAVKKFAPESVIIAVGSSPLIPDIPELKGEMC